MRRTEIAAAVDFGTSKIACMIGSMHDGILQPLGSGTAAYEGFRDGHWNREEAVPDALEEALKLAQEQAQTACRACYVGIPGEFIRVSFRRVEGTAAGETVAAADLNALRAQASDMTLAENEKIIRVRSVAWQLDGQFRTEPPVREAGREIVGFFSVVTAKEDFFRSIEALFAKTGVQIIGFVPSAVALSALAQSAEVVSPGETEEKTQVIVDVGHYSTDVIISQYGRVVDFKNIREGGHHLTQDLSKVLRLTAEEAEKVKFRCAVGVKTAGNGLMKLVNGEESVTIDAELAREVMEARIDDIAARVRMEMERFGTDDPTGVHMVLTGCGLGQVHGAREYLSQNLGMTVRSISQGTSQTPSPSLVTAAAILRLALSGKKEKSSVGILDTVRKWFSQRENGKR